MMKHISATYTHENIPSPNRKTAYLDHKQFEASLLDMIQSHMGNMDLSATWLAGKMHMSRRHLQRRIKDVHGMTPHKYIQIQKMAMVKKMIDEGRIKLVSEAAEYTGYAKVAHFSKIFKSHFDMTPSEYIRMINWQVNKME